MKFKTGAGWTRAGYHHGSDTPTSPRAVLHHTDAILCTILHTTVSNFSLQVFKGPYLVHILVVELEKV